MTYITYCDSFEFMAPATPSNDKNNKKAVIKTDPTNNDGKL